jgi:SAM-dependent methyltransferase
MIWGDGFAFPGGVDHVMQMVKPMALNPKKSMLYLGAGLGGGPRAIAKAFGTWTVGLEVSPSLAAAGMEHSKMAGLAKKALICPYDPQTIEMPAKKFDAICARHALEGIAGRERLLAELAKAMRPEGHLLISDFAAGSSAGPAAGQDAAAPIVLEDLVRQIEALRFDVRVAEDTTAEFRKLVVKGWADLAAALEGRSLDPAEAAGLAQEIQTWHARLAAFAADQVRVIRVHAIKKLG